MQKELSVQEKRALLAQRYHDLMIGYEPALDALIATGLSEGAADDLLTPPPVKEGSK